MAKELCFTVHRREAVLVVPSAPTPHETKRLSDIDDQESLRYHVPGLLVYRGGQPSPPRGSDYDDPSGIIRAAVSRALVHYYPLAGRLIEVEGRKLVIDCNGEGVVFVEADADVRLEEMEDAAAGGGHRLRPPFPCVDQLVPDVRGVAGSVISCPLLGIQVTRLLCGGFIVGNACNHSVCDAMGLVQFLNAVADIACGLPAPAALEGTWSRELLDARIPPAPAFPHREYDILPVQPPPPALPGGGREEDNIVRSFLFSSTDIATLKEEAQRHPELRGGSTATSFEVLAAFLWRARTAALAVPPDEEVRLVAVVGFGRIAALGLPPGYYGNTCAYPTVVMTARALRGCMLGDVVRLVQEAKATVTAEYVRSAAEYLMLRGRPRLARRNLLVVTDVRRVGFNRVDFGWGEPVYGGPARALPTVSLLVNVKGSNGGDDAVAAVVSLPSPVMGRFAAVLECFLKA